MTLISDGRGLLVWTVILLFKIISLLDPRILSHVFPVGASYFYHMITLLDPRMFTTWFHSWDSCILTTRFSSWILVFLPHDFPLGSFYFFHMISFLNLCIFTTLFSSLVPRIFTTWFPLWILVLLPHDFPLGSTYFVLPDYKKCVVVYM